MQQQRSIDYILFFAILALMIFGMIMISSVSVYPSFKVTTAMVAAGKLAEPNNYFYLQRNFMHVITALLAFVFVVKIPYTAYEKWSKYIFLSSIGFLFLVFFIGTRYNGAQGWIDLPLIPFSFQPAEFVKLALAVHLAAFLKKKTFEVADFERGFIPFLTILGIVGFLLAAQPDFGTILIIAPLALLIFYFGGGNVRHIVYLGLAGIVAASCVYVLGKIDFGAQNRNPLSYISSRIDNFLVRDNKTNEQNKTINFQTQQALISIGSGGFGGLGFGQSIQKFGYLPEVQGDFIFSVIAEEFGFSGVSVLIALFLFIFYRGMLIVAQVKDLFGKYLAFGITCLITLQAFINIWVNLNIVPLTGVTLPFVSYGGSSLLFSMVGVAILLNISRERNPEVLLTLREKMFSKKRVLF